MPKLSIITVNLNNAAGLRKTIESVRTQTFRDFEHIIIDGGSSDGSVSIIKEFADGFSYWVSEPDGGIYKGMNKGTKAAKGEYCLYLNSGDYLYNKKVLENVFKEKFSEDLVQGNLLIEEKSNKHYLLKSKGNLRGLKYSHPSLFIKRSLLIKLNGYSEDFKIASDWHFFLKAIFVHNASYRCIPVKISVFNENGISNNPQYTKLLRQENLELKKEIFNNPICFQVAKFSIFINAELEKTKLKHTNLNLLRRIKKRDVYVWGITMHALKVLDLLERKCIRIEAFLDSNKEYHTLNFAGYKIYEPTQILTKKNIYVIVASKDYYKEMAEICESYGLIENNDFFVPFSMPFD
jgi:glycosyltransferase involved in cell wall biosynthesis